MSQMPFVRFLYETPKSKVTQIQTRYVITKDKSIKNNKLVGVDLKKGDIIQGISITTSGDMTNDSGTESLKFTDKNNNFFSVQIGYRGFQPFFEEIKQNTMPPISVTDPKFYQQISEQMDKEDEKRRQIKFVIVLLALVAGYFAYKKFKK